MRLRIKWNFETVAHALGLQLVSLRDNHDTSFMSNRICLILGYFMESIHQTLENPSIGCVSDMVGPFSKYLYYCNANLFFVEFTNNGVTSFLSHDPPQKHPPPPPHITHTPNAGSFLLRL